MLYLLDANTLIDAKRDYFQFERVPEYWEWLVYHGREGYAPNLMDEELEKLGRDPFLVAYALVNPTDRIVVTNEVSKPGKTRANRQLPDVCAGFSITSINGFGRLSIPKCTIPSWVAGEKVGSWRLILHSETTV